MQNGKLTLILDLDHTLLNSTQFKELTQEEHDLLHECIAREAEGLKEGQRPMLYCLRHMGFFTKLRPHVFEFLESVSKICQPYVYTMGDKPYAREMVKLIDPEGTIFHGRVISNNDSRARTSRIWTSFSAEKRARSSSMTPSAFGRKIRAI